MMKLKLETNLHKMKHSMEGMFAEDIDQANVTKLTQCLLTPLLKLKQSTQVPIANAVNSKGFFKVNKPNHLMVFLGLAKRFGLSGKNKALLPKIEESNFFFIKLLNSLNRNSSLSLSILITPSIY